MQCIGKATIIIKERQKERDREIERERENEKPTQTREIATEATLFSLKTLPKAACGLGLHGRGEGLITAAYK